MTAAETLLVNFRNLMRNWFYTKDEDAANFPNWIDENIRIVDGDLIIGEDDE